MDSKTSSSQRQLRAATIGGAFGFFVDMYDVYLPTIALTPALVYFVPEGLSPTTASISMVIPGIASSLIPMSVEAGRAGNGRPVRDCLSQGVADFGRL